MAFQCSECRDCTLTPSGSRFVPLLIIPAIVGLPAISIDRLVAKGAFGLLSPRRGQWGAGGVGVVERRSIHSRGRHLRRRQAGLACRALGESRDSRIVCEWA